MKRLSLGIAVAAALGFVAGPVSAADMPVKAPPPMVMPALYNWSGVYVGVEGGAIMGQNSDFLVCSPTASDACTGFFSNVGHPLHGGFVGGEAGIDWQAPGSRWVFGIVGDGNWSELEESLTGPNTLSGVAVAMGSRISDFETVRARIGYALGPTGSFLVYVTGGWATAEQSAFFANLSLTNGPLARSEQWNRNNGFAVGGGAEYGITPWLSVKAEVLYVWLESHLYCSPHLVPACEEFFNEPVKVHDDFVLARIALDWRFNWGKGKGPAPVVARY